MENVKSKDRPVEQLIRIGEVKRLTGISTATLYRKISPKEFPPPVQLGVAARAWPLSEVQNWIAGRIELRGASITDTTNNTDTVPNPMSIIKSHVDRLFKDAAPVHGQRCQNPVTGGYWLPGDDPISHQKRMACDALFAREWFAIYGPHDAPLLPLSDAELEDLKYTDPFSHIVEGFAYSLRAHNWGFNSHPSFEDFACGMMASEHAPDLIKKADALRKRYPPRPLRYLNPGNCWEPPKLYARTMASHRRSMARCK